MNIELELLRFELRLAKDLQCLSIKSYGRTAEALINIGKQVGGWEETSREMSFATPNRKSLA